MTSIFSEIAGITTEIEVIEFRDGTGQGGLTKIPGRVKYPNVVLKAGLVADSAFFQWIEAIRQGQLVRKTLTITLLDGQNRPIARYKLFNAWPSKWEASALDARPSSVAIETIEITHEGLQLERRP